MALTGDGGRPSTFRPPVEKIRDGYYSDAYFNYTKALLEADDRHPHVLMQVFQRQDSVLGGSTRRSRRQAGVRSPRRRRPLGQRLQEPEVHALYRATRSRRGERMTIGATTACSPT
jgi:hypothetical protein